MTNDYVQARERMVAEQLVSRGIKDPRVLRAMAKIPRHLFLESELWDHAYEDHPLPHRGEADNFTALYCGAYG